MIINNYLNADCNDIPHSARWRSTPFPSYAQGFGGQSEGGIKNKKPRRSPALFADRDKPNPNTKFMQKTTNIKVYRPPDLLLPNGKMRLNIN